MKATAGELAGRRIVLGVTGGIAAYKACELASRLAQAGAEVQVALSEAATRFIAPLTFQALTGRPALVSLWQDGSADGMAHIALTRGAAAIVVAPATADFLARLALGQADDLLTALCLARDCPLLVAPAMNHRMWLNPATQRNVALLREDGVVFLGPTSGRQACGEEGEGRLLEPEEIYRSLVGYFQPKRLLGKRVLLTAGPTFEPLDPVRGITNRSSGKMGFALARACQEAGAEVTLVAGPVCLPTPFGVTRLDVVTAEEMRAAVLAQLPVDVFISVAAVADYRPAAVAEQKIKKGTETLTIELVPNRDILAEVAAQPRPPFCVGFAAESQDLDAYAEAKRQKKRLPLVVGNLLHDGIGGEQNIVTLYDAQGRHPLPPTDKLTLARQIVAHVAKMLDHAQD